MLILDGSTEVWRRVFDVNVMALCICTREAIKVMKENEIDGHIVHINSIAGHFVPHFPKPVLNVYPASKFAVTALTETLIHELRSEGSKIKVTVSYSRKAVEMYILDHIINQTLLASSLNSKNEDD